MKISHVSRSLFTTAAFGVALLWGWFAAQHTQVPNAFAAMTMSRGPASHAVAPRAASAAIAVAATTPHTTPHTTPRATPAHAAPAHATSTLHGATPPSVVSSSVAEKGPREKLAALREPLSPESANDPFGVLSWLPPPPPPPPEPAPAPVQEAAPVAPPLPFAYLGTMNGQAGKPEVFLSNGDRLLIVSPGEVIDGQYRFESIDAPGAVFTYLPLNQKQVMSIEGAGESK